MLNAQCPMPNTCGAKVLEEVEAEVVGNVRELDRDGGDGARRAQHLVRSGLELGLGLGQGLGFQLVALSVEENQG